MAQRTTLDGSCDNCASTLEPHFWISTTVYGESVDLCSPACVHTLKMRWHSPAKKPLTGFARFTTLLHVVFHTVFTHF